MMKDAFISQRIYGLAAKYVSTTPQSPQVTAVQKFVRTANAFGLQDDKTAYAADELYDVLRTLDSNGDGNLADENTASVRAWHDLYRALIENDADANGDIDAIDKLAAVGDGQSKATSTTLAPDAFGDIERRVVVLTCWSSRGARWAWEQSRPLIDLAQPDAVCLHTDPYSLASQGARLNEDVRRANPGIRVVWAIYGDSYGPDPSRPWRAYARAAGADSVESAMVDAEGAWKTKGHGEDLSARSANASRALRAMREGDPAVHISHTSYDGPVSIVRPDKKGRWGGHENYPWAAFVGKNSPVQASAWQVYVGNDKENPGTYDMATNRFDRHELSIEAAAKRELLGKQCEPWMYFQIHDVSTSAVCALAEQRRVSFAWASPTRVDSTGAIGFRMTCALARLNMTVEEFQKANGLKADKKAGPKTQAALGIK